MKTWTAQDIERLGATISIVVAGEILGIGRTKAYELAARNEFPVPVLRVKGRYQVPTAALKHLLGIRKENGGSA
ncbi:DNA-binding protein [Parafrankia sp. BMG5.11]|uniref:DNA-binding protein n=1 Tax=Parafrankia sp. BMG5.11 TaxID=222540 RepID=UPI00103CAFD8|nr:DNA-binding protein [Parafrankia sp. BMG5.11]TCJ34508.1 DNA-binding protein [Parafrankia sp. BMG5.11]